MFWGDSYSGQMYGYMIAMVQTLLIKLREINQEFTPERRQLHSRLQISPLPGYYQKKVASLQRLGVNMYVRRWGLTLCDSDSASWSVPVFLSSFKNCVCAAELSAYRWRWYWSCSWLGNNICAVVHIQALLNITVSEIQQKYFKGVKWKPEGYRAIGTISLTLFSKINQSCSNHDQKQCSI